MSVTPQVLVEPQYVSTATTTYYTGNLSTTTMIRKALFTNVSAGAVTLNVWLVPNANSAGNSNKLLAALSISAGQTYNAVELAGLMLSGGDTIQMSASVATSIVAAFSGFVFS